MKELFMRLMREEDGQGMAEYGLILALIAVVVIGALSLMGDQIKAAFELITGELAGVDGIEEEY